MISTQTRFENIVPFSWPQNGFLKRFSSFSLVAFCFDDSFLMGGRTRSSAPTVVCEVVEGDLILLQMRRGDFDNRVDGGVVTQPGEEQFHVAGCS